MLSSFFLVAMAAPAAEGFGHLNLLKNVVTLKDNETVVFRLEFQNPVGAFKGPVFFKKSIQVDFADSFIKPAKKYFPTEDLLVSQIYAAQFNPDTLRVRFMFDGDGKDISKNFHLSKQGRFLEARIDTAEGDVLQDLLKTIRERDKNRAEEPEVTASPVEPVASPSLFDRKSADESPQPALAVRVKTEKKSSPPVKTLSMTGGQKTFQFLDFQRPSEKGPPDLMSSGITMVSMLAVVLGLMFFVFYLFKKFVLKNGLLGGNGNLISVLGTGMIAPRKTVALVEVVGEILVLGISNDHIALLSTIQDERKIEKIKSEHFSKRRSSFEFGNGEMRAPLQGTGQSGEDFKKYLKGFTSAENKPSKEQSIAGVREMIRKNLRKVQTA
ncbi:MAG: flagellar biosynthetic protein FliO [Nitrospinota bacterium]|nr:flagellar biosynthetic protein FliO [Nitrospinota bacterium]